MLWIGVEHTGFWCLRVSTIFLKYCEACGCCLCVCFCCVLYTARAKDPRVRSDPEGCCQAQGSGPVSTFCRRGETTTKTEDSGHHRLVAVLTSGRSDPDGSGSAVGLVASR